MPTVHGTKYLCLDLASAPIVGADVYLEPVSAPSNYKNPEAIAAYVKDKTAERLEYAGLDVDLARITAVGLYDDAPSVQLCQDEDAERAAVQQLACQLDFAGTVRLITYNGLSFDLPLLMRRARYLGVAFPKLNIDRYRSPHVDLMADLSDRDPSRRRPLGFYVRRLGWTDLVKCLDGAEESRVPETGRWADLEASVVCDVTATYRLACWLGHLPMPATEGQPF